MALTKTPIELSSTPSIVDGGNATAITIDSSENVLVGQTTASSGTVGTSLRSDGRNFYCADGNYSGHFNRKSSDGAIVHFAMNDTIVGSIQSRAGVVSTIILDPRTNGVGLTGTATAVIPTSNTGVLSNAAMDIGGSGYAFKDLYLSGGAYLGGTGAANKLEDYETGTWTPTDNGAANASINIISAKYTKIGRLVNISMYLTITATSTAQVEIGGLPFTPVGPNTYAVAPVNHNGSAGTPLFRVQSASTVGVGMNFNNTNVAFASLNGSIFITSVTYFTTA